MNKVNPVNFTWGSDQNWAALNRKNGSYSFVCGVAGTTAGCLKAGLDEDSKLYKVLNFLHSLAYGLRNYFQYSIYSGKTDDLEEDKIKKPYRAKIGSVGCFIEKKVNPILLPISSLFGEKVRNIYTELAHLPNFLWWRIRLCKGDMNLRDLKDIFQYFVQLFKAKSPTTRNKLVDKIEKKVTSFLALLGSLTMGIFRPIKAINLFKDSENRLVNFFNNLSFASQHAIYLLRFSLPEYFKAKQNYSNNSKLLSFLGLGANFMNIGLPVVEALPFENRFFKVAQKIYNELATGFTVSFFSSRRHFMEKQDFSTVKINYY